MVASANLRVALRGLSTGKEDTGIAKYMPVHTVFRPNPVGRARVILFSGYVWSSMTLQLRNSGAWDRGIQPEDQRKSLLSLLVGG